MNNSYLHLLQISFSNLYKQKNKIKQNLENLLKNENETEELFGILFKIDDGLKKETSNKIIDQFLIDKKLLIEQI